MKLYKNKHWLKKKYLVDDFSSDEIGKFCGVNGRTIRYYLKKFKIKLEKNNYIMEKNIHIFVPTYIYKNLKKHSRSQKTSMSSIVRVALIEFLVKNNLNPYKEKK